MNIPAPDTMVGQLTFNDKIYSAETLSSMFDQTALVQSMTQEQYDALKEYDENTIYVIIND